MLSLFASLLIATSFACTSINKNAIKWESYNNQLYLNGKRFNMKGLSWFGFETGRGQLDGLDKHNMNWYFQWMVDRGFNAIRMPFASDFLNNKNGWDKYIDAVMAAGEYGIFIMLDMHSKTEGAWTDGLYTIDQDDEVETWRTLAEKLVAAGAWNVLFVDVFNEPHDVSNDQWGSWLDFCERVAEAVWDAGLNALIAVEGTGSNCLDDVWCAWGENVIGPRNKGLVFSASKSNKFVWSPHVYGGDVTGNYNYATKYWNNHWAYLATSTTYNKGTEAAIVIGEFGTKYTGSMVNWLDDLIEYLISIDQRNHFYWCLNPNSGDTGGLLQDDWETEQTSKLNALDKLQPNPTTLTVSSNKICVTGLGESADAPSGSSGSNPTPKPTAKPTSSSSSGGSIKIKENSNSNQWWVAIEFPNGDNGAKGITSLEIRDSNHKSWLKGSFENWGTGAYSFSDGTQFSGNQHFRVNGQKATWNVISGVNGGATAFINLPGSSFTEEEEGAASGSQIAGIIAGIIAALLCVLCIGFAIYYYKKTGINKGEASFQSTGTDTPTGNTKGGDTPISDEMPQQTADNDAEAEIEIEMEVETTQ